MNSGIYTITNILTLKLYVGSSARIQHRWNSHRKMLRNKRHPNIYLQSAWDKYGEDVFDFSIIEITHPDRLIEREQVWIDALCCHISNWGYNISPSAKNSAGSKRTPETRKKISENSKRQMRDPLMRLKLSLAKKGKPETIAAARKGGLANKGRKVDEEIRDKISNTLMGHRVSSETRSKQSAAKIGKPSPHKGKKYSPEICENISKALKKRTSEQIQAWKAKLRAVNLGKKHSIESRLKQSTAQIGKRHISDEMKLSMSIRAKIRHAQKVAK